MTFFATPQKVKTIVHKYSEKLCTITTKLVWNPELYKWGGKLMESSLQHDTTYFKLSIFINYSIEQFRNLKIKMKKCINDGWVKYKWVIWLGDIQYIYCWYGAKMHFKMASSDDQAPLSWQHNAFLKKLKKVQIQLASCRKNVSIRHPRLMYKSYYFQLILHYLSIISPLCTYAAAPNRKTGSI